eukprot:Gregarina_sp_Pseudo_9__4612@NODE_47_length_4897_cov_61_486208_g44_i0_p1_GENE_NODE_47_length_4897_cov_61_486208_g44_i0NODE_47_length_4897_cov_61_486208_g44_i0_p1_ORF_typecomplete_len539_score93_70RNase_Zc3h12a/PF11977_8/5_1e03RNase_Zc3h12a/PF11977_8/0_16RNase_Zc3h12a/PF11977_8/1_6e03_NODE_47_length_4897_cov_61_486208_g44_i016883304
MFAQIADKSVFVPRWFSAQVRDSRISEWDHDKVSLRQTLFNNRDGEKTVMRHVTIVGVKLLPLCESSLFHVQSHSNSSHILSLIIGTLEEVVETVQAAQSALCLRFKINNVRCRPSVEAANLAHFPKHQKRMFEEFEKALGRREQDRRKQQYYGEEEEEEETWGAPLSYVPRSAPPDQRRFNSRDYGDTRFESAKFADGGWLMKGEQRRGEPMRRRPRTAPGGRAPSRLRGGAVGHARSMRVEGMLGQTLKQHKLNVGNWRLLPTKSFFSDFEMAMAKKLEASVDSLDLSVFVDSLPDLGTPLSVSPPWPWNEFMQVDNTQPPIILDAVGIAFHHGERRGFLSFAGLAIVFRNIKFVNPRRNIRIIFFEDELKAFWQPRRSELFVHNKDCYESLFASDVAKVLPAQPYTNYLGMQLRSIEGNPTVTIECRDVLTSSGWDTMSSFRGMSLTGLLRHCRTRSRFGRTLGKVETLAKYTKECGGKLVSNDFKQFVPLGLLHRDSEDTDMSLFEYMTMNRLTYVFPSSEQFIFASDRFESQE